MAYGDFSFLVAQGRLGESIASLEDCLRASRETPYHAVLGRDFLHQTDAAAEYLGSFFEKASETLKVKALYFEMNEFEINPDLWYFSGFAYEKAGGIWDLEWLASWDGETGEDFELIGMEPVQTAFKDLYADERQSLAVKVAAELTMYLVTARFMELIAAAQEQAKATWKALGGLPVFASAHEWDVVHKTAFQPPGT